MIRPELPESPRPAPATSLPPLRQRSRRRVQRADLDGCMFDVVWPLPRAIEVPTLARRVAALLIDLEQSGEHDETRDREVDRSL